MRAPTSRAYRAHTKDRNPVWHGAIEHEVIAAGETARTLADFVARNTHLRKIQEFLQQLVELVDNAIGRGDVIGSDVEPELIKIISG